MNRYHIIRTLVLLLFSLSLTTQLNAIDYMPQTLTVSDGLSQNSVTAILRDSRGFLWIGTRYGLGKYDNSNIRNYFSSGEGMGSINNNMIYDLFEDELGNIWVLDLDGVSHYNSNTQTFTQISYDGREIRGRSIATINGRVVISGTYGKLYSIDPHTLQAEVVNDGPIQKSFKSIIPWINNKYILSSRFDGVWVLDPKDYSLTEMKYPGSDNLIAFTTDAYGNLWSSSYGKGVDCISPSGVPLAHFDTSNGLQSDIIIDIVETPQFILVGSEKGVDVIDKARRTLRPNPLSTSVQSVGAVLRLYVDRFGNIYVGSVRNGLIILQGVSINTFRLNPTRLVENAVTSFATAGNRNELLCGIDGTGVTSFNTTTEQLYHYPSTDNRKIMSMAPVSDHEVMLSEYGKGLFLLDTKTGQLRMPAEPLNRLSELLFTRELGYKLKAIKPGVIALASDTMYLYNMAENSVRRIDIPDDIPHKGQMQLFYADTAKVLGYTQQSVIWFDLRNMSCRRLFASPDVEAIKAAQYNGGDSLFVATADHIYLYSMKKGTNRPLNIDARNITSLMIDNNSLWVGANNKLYKIYGKKIQSFERGDGLPTNEFMPLAIHSDNRYLYFGGTNGIVRVNRHETDSISRFRANAVQLSLGSLTINGHQAMGHVVDGKVKVPAREAAVAVSVIELEQNPMRSKLFRFYLDGLDMSAPIETPDRNITFNDLPSGATIGIRVSCTLPDGSWSEPVKLITLDIEQVWWRSWWFISIICALALSLLWLLWRFLVQRREAEHNRMRRYLLEHDVQILANLNESLREPLENIYNPLIDASVQLDDMATPEADSALEQVNSALDRIDAMRRIVDNPFGILHSNNLNLTSSPLTARFNVWLSDMLESYHKAHSASAGFTIDFNPDYDPGMITFDSALLEMTITCLLADLMSHGAKSLAVVITEDEATGYMSIGFNSEATPAGDGKESLRVIYARWLASLSSATIATEVTDHGNICRATLAMPVTKDSDSLGSIALADMGKCTLVVVNAASDFADDVKARLADKFVFTTGASAIKETLAAANPILIVDGSENQDEATLICHKLKNDTDGKILGLIMLTPSSHESLRDKQYRNDVDCFLAKPFDMSVLLNICRKIASQYSTNSSTNQR